MSLTYVYQKDCLKGEYQKVFDKVELYANVYGIGDESKNDALLNLIDMLSVAQSKDEGTEKIVGNDLSKFCRQYFSNYRALGRTLEALRSIYKMMWWVLVFSGMEMIAATAEKDFNFFKTTTDIMPYIYGYMFFGVILIIINEIFKKMIFKKKISNGVYQFVVMLACIGFIVYTFFMYNEDIIINIPLFIALLVSGIYVITYIIARAIYNYKTYGSIRKPKELGGFNDMVYNEMKRTLPKDFIKKYDKKNKKREKKGLPKFTKEEFMEKVVCYELIRAEKNRKRAIIFMIVFGFGFGIFEIFNTSLMDGLLFILFYFIVEFFIILVFFRETKYERAMKEIINECKEEKIDIFEYAKRLEEVTEEEIVDEEEKIE